jgi:hypothetical protein
MGLKADFYQFSENNRMSLKIPDPVKFVPHKNHMTPFRKNSKYLLKPSLLYISIVCAVSFDYNY